MDCEADSRPVSPPVAGVDALAAARPVGSGGEATRGGEGVAKVRFGLLVLALLLLVVACVARAHWQQPYEDLRTHAHVGRDLLRDEARPASVAARLLPGVVGGALLAYLPAEALFLTSLFVLAWALRGGGRDSLEVPRHFSLCVGGGVAWTAWWIGQEAFAGFPFAGDEFAYLFQARVMAMGGLSAPSPAPLEYFACNNLINNGQWCAVYPPGWPMLLSLADGVGLCSLVNPLAAAFCLGALLLLGRELFGRRAAAMAVLLVAFSPAFVLNAASGFSHVSQSLFTVMTLWLFVKARRTPGSLLFPASCGMALGMAFLVRPVECGLLVLLLLALHGAMEVAEPGSLREPRLLLVPLLAGLVGSFWCICNLHQVGSAFRTAYSLDFGTGLLDAAGMGHSAAAGVLNTAYSLGRMLVWQSPLLAELLLVGAWLSRRTPAAVLLTYGVVTVGAFGMYFTVGQVEYGARFYLCAWVVTALVAGAGAEALVARWHLTRRQVVAGLLFWLVFTGAAAWPGFVRAAASVHQGAATLDRFIREKAGQRALVFIRNTPDGYAAWLNRNMPDFSDGPRRLLFLDVEKNRRVRRLHSERPAFVLDYDPAIGTYRLLPFSHGFPDALDHVVAGINYASSLHDSEQALREFAAVPTRSPWHAAASYNRLTVLFRAGRHADVVREAEACTRTHGPTLETCTLWGRSLLVLGQAEQASVVLARAVALGAPGSRGRQQSENWLRRARGE